MALADLLPKLCDGTSDLSIASESSRSAFALKRLRAVAAAELGQDIRQVSRPLVCVQNRRRRKGLRGMAAVALGEEIWGEQLLEHFRSKERSVDPCRQQWLSLSGAESATRARTSQPSTSAVVHVDVGAQVKQLVERGRSQNMPAAFLCQQRPPQRCQQRCQQLCQQRYAGAVTVTRARRSHGSSRAVVSVESSGESCKPRSRSWVPHCAHSGCLRRGVFCSIGLAKVRWCGDHRPITASRRCDRT